MRRRPDRERSDLGPRRKPWNAPRARRTRRDSATTPGKDGSEGRRAEIRPTLDEVDRGRPERFAASRISPGTVEARVADRGAEAPGWRKQAAIKDHVMTQSSPVASARGLSKW